jgi:hypothetical protein
MPGFWEILLIGLVIATIVVPYFNKKKAAEKLAEKKKQKKIYKAPEAKEVDFEED